MDRISTYHPRDAVVAKGRAVTLNHEVTHDWLLLKLTDQAAHLPATPLVPRNMPVAVGETVYLVGVPYTDAKSAQNVYKGVVTGRPLPHYFTYEFSPAVKINGFSGAPIVDGRGLLVGHGVSRTDLKTDAAGLEVEFGGEDASYLLNLWGHRDDPSSAALVAARHVTLPDGWKPDTSTLKSVLQKAACRNPAAGFMLFAQPKTDFEDGYSLLDYARDDRDVSGAALGKRMTDKNVGDVASGAANGVQTAEYTVAVTLKGFSVKYRRVSVEVGGCYCELVFWADAKTFDAAQPQFNQIVANLK